jgi:hypothetical protein
MIRTILSVAVVSAVAIASVQANPPSRSKKKKASSKAIPKIVPAAPLASGWSYVNGVWTHSDGYRLVNGQVVRSGIQTHKPPPKPPTKAEMNFVLKKKKAPQTPAEAAAAKAAQRERNLRPGPAPQTGTHL